MRPKTHSDRITMRNGSHNRVFRARAAVIMPSRRVDTGQRGVGEPVRIIMTSLAPHPITERDGCPVSPNVRQG